MRGLEIPYARLLRQRVAGEGLPRPADVVRWLGAIQAQDYAAAKWAVGLRTVACTDADLDAALASGEILRTHVMRPTWHFVAPEDLKWMQMLTGPRVEALLAYQYKRLELDAATLRRSEAVMEKALRSGKQLTRTELSNVLAKAGIPAASGLRMIHILAHAELNALICSGGRRGKQFTYALVDERAPHQLELGRDEALALLTRRYFSSHGPATAQDFAWWSGLTVAEVKRGIDMLHGELVHEEIEGRVHWLTPLAPAARHSRGSIHLLPNYDEYKVGYTDRTAIFEAERAAQYDARSNPVLANTIISRGRVAGTWSRTVGKDGLHIAVAPFVRPNKAEVRALGVAGKRLAKFLDLPIAAFDLQQPPLRS